VIFPGDLTRFVDVAQSLVFVDVAESLALVFVDVAECLVVCGVRSWLWKSHWMEHIETAE
jgi:hypothetical protein